MGLITPSSIIHDVVSIVGREIRYWGRKFGMLKINSTMKVKKW
jgi:hypothetical protein